MSNSGRAVYGASIDNMKRYVQKFVEERVGNEDTAKRYVRHLKKVDPVWVKHKNYDTKDGLLSRGYIKRTQIVDTEKEGIKQQEINPDHQTTVLIKHHRRFTNTEEMAEFCNIDLKEWEPYKIVVNEWNMSLDYLCFQYKVWWRKIKSPTIDYIKQEIVELARFVPPVLPQYKYVKSGKALELNIPDHHLGRLSWGKESGTRYDVNLAEELWVKCHQYFFLRHESEILDTVVIMLGSDFFNVNNAVNMTANGTLQVEDGRWQRSFKHGEQAAIRSIEIWRSRGVKVYVYMIPGNHDIERNFYLGCTLEAYYKNIDQVEIINTPEPRKYFVYGRNMIGFTHGKDDAKQLRTIYQSEMREYLSKCDNIEIHVGHLHGEKMIEDTGSVIIRYMSSLAPRGSWETYKGYSAKRRAQAFLWDRKEGLDTITQYSPPDRGI